MMSSVSHLDLDLPIMSLKLRNYLQLYEVDTHVEELRETVVRRCRFGCMTDIQMYNCYILSALFVFSFLRLLAPGFSLPWFEVLSGMTASKISLEISGKPIKRKYGQMFLVDISQLMVVPYVPN